MSGLLAADHAALDKLLHELCFAFEGGELQNIHQRLDQFWARLAVHIRAEHLGLFPAIVRALKDNDRGIQGAPSLSEARRVIEELRGDHDYFMRELSRALTSVRGLLNVSDNPLRRKDVETVEARIRAVVERLATHNEVEEGGIYR